MKLPRYNFYNSYCKVFVNTHKVSKMLSLFHQQIPPGNQLLQLHLLGVVSQFSLFGFTLKLVSNYQRVCQG